MKIFKLVCVILICPLLHANLGIQTVFSPSPLATGHHRKSTGECQTRCEK